MQLESQDPAWRLYMEEVRKYKEQTCKEYHGVPIVK
jgi:hypothetical protein